MSIITVTADNFDEAVKNESKTVLLDFWASWCGPCQMISPIVEQVANERDDITVGKVNVDEQMELAQEFGITSIPTLVVIKNAKVAGQSVGLISKSEINELIDNAK